MAAGWQCEQLPDSYSSAISYDRTHIPGCHVTKQCAGHMTDAYFRVRRSLISFAAGGDTARQLAKGNRHHGKCEKHIRDQYLFIYDEFNGSRDHPAPRRARLPRIRIDDV